VEISQPSDKSAKVGRESAELAINQPNHHPHPSTSLHNLQNQNKGATLKRATSLF